MPPRDPAAALDYLRRFSRRGVEVHVVGRGRIEADTAAGFIVTAVEGLAAKHYQRVCLTRIPPTLVEAPMEMGWKLSKEPLADIGFSVVNTLLKGGREQLPDLADLLPFSSRWELKGHVADTWLAFRLIDRPGSGVPLIGRFDDTELGALQS